MNRFVLWLRTLIIWCLRLLLMTLLLRYSTPPLGDIHVQIAFQAGSLIFDYVGWTIQALAAKTVETVWGAHPFITEADRAAYVRRYMQDLARVHMLDGQIDFIYADPFIRDPDSASAEARAERAALRATLSERQSLVEAILEGQVAAVLVDEGFGVSGQLMPPISMRFTRVPNFLIISPRNSIRFDYGFALYALGADEQSTLEAQIEAKHEDVSVLIVPLGGVALYPAMILERSSIAASLDTFAHEWLHHYLALFPLGLAYDFDNEARIINETTASLFGRELSQLVLARYYREPAAQDDAHPAQLMLRLPSLTRQTPSFDYGSAMHETRIRVDELLAAGQIDEAEAYMEGRRRLFVNNGYLIRRLNQAYFAFYGGYQSGTPGAGGEDPIGPAVQRVRDRSTSIYEWIFTMRGVTTRDQLLALANE